MLLFTVLVGILFQISLKQVHICINIHQLGLSINILGAVLAAFKGLNSQHTEGIPTEELRKFLTGWFSGPGDELKDWTPTDWTQESV